MKLLLLCYCLLLIGTPVLGATETDEILISKGPTAVPTRMPAIYILPRARIIEGVAIYSQTFGSDEARRLSQDGVDIGPASFKEYIDLEQGNILIAPYQKAIIGTGLAKINVAAGAIAFVMKSAEGLVVYDLYESKSSDISIVINKNKIAIEPGEMLVIANEEGKDFDHLKLDCHTVAYSNVKEIDLAQHNKFAYIAKFSIDSAAATIRPLIALSQSSSRADKLLAERIVGEPITIHNVGMETVADDK